MLFIFISIFIIIIFVIGIVSNSYAKKSNKKLEEKLLTDFGKIPTNNFDERDLETMKNFYKSFPIKSDVIDDITWKDLDMDLLFKRIKNTQSGVGDEYLYRFMRHQKTNCDNHFEEVIEYMINHPEERIKLQKSIKKIGRKPASKTYYSGNGYEASQDAFTIEGISLSNFVVNPKARPAIEKWIKNLTIVITVINIFGLIFGLSGLFGIAGFFVFMTYGIIILLFGAIFTTSLLKKQWTTYEDLDSFIKLINSAKEISINQFKPLKNEFECLNKSLLRFNKINIIDTAFLTNNSVIISILNLTFGFHVHSYKRYLLMVQNNQQAAQEIFEIIGFLELCISVASYRKSLSYYCHPIFSDNKKLSFENMIHPLLKKPISNSDVIGDKIIITGSNASGKSTFAKTLALNTYLGQVFNMCLADKFSFRNANIITSMSIKDDISEGDSYFVAEVKGIKRMVKNLNKNSCPMLFLDEIFKGTNTVERIASAMAFMKKFAKANCFICLTTHDLELSHLLEGLYENYHFSEIIGIDDIKFDYKFKHGIVNGSNAIKMLDYYKIEKDIVKNAQAFADGFRKNGVWKI